MCTCPFLGKKSSVSFLTYPHLRRCIPYPLLGSRKEYPVLKAYLPGLLMGTKACVQCLVRQEAATSQSSGSLVQVPTAGPSGKGATLLSPSLNVSSVSHSSCHHQRMKIFLTTGTVPTPGRHTTTNIPLPTCHREP